MNYSTQIKCPNCGTEIDVQNVLSHQLEDEIKKKYQSQLAGERQKFEQQETSLKQAKANFVEEKRQPMTNSQNFAANEVTSESFFGGLFVLLGSDHLSLFNTVSGEILPLGTTEPTQVSLFKKDVTEIDRIGAKGNYDSSLLSAKERYGRDEFTRTYTFYQLT